MRIFSGDVPVIGLVSACVVCSSQFDDKDTFPQLQQLFAGDLSRLANMNVDFLTRSTRNPGGVTPLSLAHLSFSASV